MQTGEDGIPHPKWYSSISCRELLLTKYPDAGPDVYMEYPADELWVCPLVDEVELLNDPFLFRGKNFAMVVNRCDVAASIDAENGLSTYANTTCVDSTRIDDAITDIRGLYKTVQHVFAPEYY